MQKTKEIDKLRYSLIEKYKDENTSLRLITTLRASSLYKAICHGVEYQIELFKDGTFEIDDTNDLTCSVCGCDTNLCECAESNVEYGVEAYSEVTGATTRWFDSKDMRDSWLIDMGINDFYLITRDKKTEEEKKYITIDNEGCLWRGYNANGPETEKEIRKHFWGFGEVRTKDFSNFTMDYISEVWNVDFIDFAETKTQNSNEIKDIFQGRAITNSVLLEYGISELSEVEYVYSGEKIKESDLRMIVYKKDK